MQDSLSEIEQAHAALRESIERSKALADKSARLVERYRSEIAKAEPPNPAR